MQRILITGANRGVGLEFVKQYLTAGEQVYAACRNPDKADALRELAADTRRLTIIALDPGSEDSIHHLPDALAEYTDALDMLINNAGMNVSSPEYRELGSLQADALLRTLRINAVGPVLIAQALHGFLKAGTQPKVINISSQVGSMDWKRSGSGYAYASSKAALNMYTRVLAADLRADSVIVVTIHPGWVQTDMGGAGATLTPYESVSSMLHFFDGLTIEHTGGFYRWDGTVHPW